MSIALLDKTRKINKLLYNAQSTKVAFQDIGEVLSEALQSNVLILSKKGKVLSASRGENVPEIEEMLTAKNGEYIDRMLNERFLDVLSTRENANLMMFGFSEEICTAYHALILPLMIAGERLGTIFLYRQTGEYTIDDIIVGEYSTTVVALAMVRSVDEELAEERRQKQKVVAAVQTLSHSELEAISQVFSDLRGSEGIVVASKIAERVGITRSILVNALRKLESAAIIESRSSGMKGTYVKVINPYIFEEVDRVRSKHAGK